MSDGFWWIRVDDRGEKRQSIKSIWKHLTHATFKQYIPPIYNLLLVTGLMSWRQTATRLAQRQSAQRILADVTTGGSWLAGWGLKGQGLRWQSGQTAKTQFMTLPGLPLQPNLPV